MARPERRDADYFPFYVKDGKTLFILESKYGLQGIGFFTNLMRFLTRQTDHHICIDDESDRLYFFAQLHCPEDIGMDMLGMMVKTGKIDAQLWGEKRVIASSDLLKSLSGAYENRKNKIITIEEIRVNYLNNDVSPVSITPKTELNGENEGNNPQSKLKESKLKESITKQNKTPLPDGFTISPEVRTWAKKKGHSRLEEHLESFISKCKANGYQYIDWNSAFMEAIRSDWAKLNQQQDNSSKGKQQLGGNGGKAQSLYVVCKKCKKEVLPSDYEEKQGHCIHCMPRAPLDKILSMAKSIGKDMPTVSDDEAAFE
jgi:hypothetical protein